MEGVLETLELKRRALARPAARRRTAEKERPVIARLLKRPWKTRRSRPAAGLALAVALGLGVLGGLAPAEAAACDRSYCQNGGCVSSDDVRQMARRSFGGGWTVLSVRLVNGGPAPSCLWYEVRLKGPNGAGQIARWHVNGARAN